MGVYYGGWGFLPPHGVPHQRKQIVADPRESIHECMGSAIAFAQDASVQESGFDEQDQMCLHHGLIVSIK